MSSRDFGFLTLRNTTAYQPNGLPVPPNNIFITSTNGAAVFSNNLLISSINVSSIITNNLLVNSTATTSTLITNSAFVNGRLSVAGGSEIVPGIYFSGDDDTGFYNDTASEIGITSNGQTRMLIDNQDINITPNDNGGLVNIQTTSNNDATTLNIQNNGTVSTAVEIILNAGNAGYSLSVAQPESAPFGLIPSTFQLISYYPTQNNVLTIYPNGNMIIGGALSTSVLNMAQGQINGVSTINGLSWPPIDDALWSKNGNDIYNDNTGNVGIGTSSPLVKFQVGEDGGNDFYSNTQNQSTIIYGPSVYPSTTDNPLDPINNSNYPSGLLITTNELPNTNVGAGIALGGRQIFDSTITTFARISGVASGPIEGDCTIETLHQTSGPTAGLIERMRIKNTGDVGIGTSNPQAKLDVNGTIRANDGTSAAPSIFFSTDANTGLYGIGDGQMGICSNGQQRILIDTNVTISPASGSVCNISNNNDNGYTGLNIQNTGTISTTSRLTLTSANGSYGLYSTEAGGSPFESGLIPSTFQIYSYFPTASNVFTIYPGGNATLLGTLTQLSDKRLKSNIDKINNPLSTLIQLQGVTYFNKNDISDRKLGLIAQDVETILPEVVITDNTSEKYKSVAYGNIVALTIEAIKELSDRVTDLSNKVNILMSK